MKQSTKYILLSAGAFLAYRLVRQVRSSVSGLGGGVYQKTVAAKAPVGVTDPSGTWSPTIRLPAGTPFPERSSDSYTPPAQQQSPAGGAPPYYVRYPAPGGGYADVPFGSLPMNRSAPAQVAAARAEIDAMHAPTSAGPVRSFNQNTLSPTQKESFERWIQAKNQWKDAQQTWGQWQQDVQQAKKDGVAPPPPPNIPQPPAIPPAPPSWYAQSGTAQSKALQDRMVQEEVRRAATAAGVPSGQVQSQYGSRYKVDGKWYGEGPMQVQTLDPFGALQGPDKSALYAYQSQLYQMRIAAGLDPYLGINVNQIPFAQRGLLPTQAINTGGTWSGAFRLDPRQASVGAQIAPSVSQQEKTTSSFERLKEINAALAQVRGYLTPTEFAAIQQEKVALLREIPANLRRFV